MAKKAKKECSPEERLAAARVPKEEWPYELPEGWEWVTGHAIFESMESQKPEGEIFRYIDIDSIDNRNQRVVEPKVLRVDEAPSRARRKVHSGDTVFSMVRPYLKNIAYIDETLNDCIASTGFFVCKPSGFVNSKFLYWMMVSPYVVDGLNRYMKGDNSPSIRKDDVENYKYPLPPLKTQQRIVDHIESLFAKLDQAKEKAQQALATSESRKAAILHQAFTGQLTAHWREENGVSMDSWEEMALKDCGKWNGGGTPSMQHPEYWEDGDILWISSKDMKSDEIEDTMMYVNMVGVENSSAKYIEEPSLLFVTRSGILRRTLPIAMVKQPFTVNQDLKVLTPRQGIDLAYLFWVCKAHEQKMLKTCMKSGTTVESINFSALKQFEVPIASVKEQQEIVRILDTLMANERRIQQAVETILQQIDDTKKSILAKAFRGEWQ